MPRNKHKPQQRPPNLLEEAPADQKQIVLRAMLKECKDHMDNENAANKVIAELHKKAGTSNLQQMNKKQRSDAHEAYKKNVVDMDKGRNLLASHINALKEARLSAIAEWRKTKEASGIQILELRCGCSPIWTPSISEEPLGVAGVKIPDDQKLEKGDEVAAFMEDSKTWIAAEVINAASNNRYECFDTDDKEMKPVMFSRKQLIPMPKYTVDYKRYPWLAFPKNAIILALFPKTTCFYEGIVHAPPDQVSGKYKIRFVDNQRASNYADPVEVSDRYVVAFRQDPVVNARPSKKADLETEDSNQPSTSGSQKQTKSKKKIATITLDDDKGSPGPALIAEFKKPKDVLLSPKKSKPKPKSKEPKVKIIRAKVPPHKKYFSTRQFGKKRVKRKPKNAVSSSSTQNEPSISEDPKEASKSERKQEEEMEHDGEDETGGMDDMLDGLNEFGLEDEREDTDDEKDNGAEKAGDEEEDEEREGEVEDEAEDAVIDLADEDNNNDEADNTRNSVTPYQDCEEGTSTGPDGTVNKNGLENETGKRSRSSSSSSSVQSGLSDSDHEGDRPAISLDSE
ncbi:hypothetical protein L5515_017888 [Caenorhabditis briggsae]|uniref:SGF29 C-terminal domain-containing protein n=2 Tax=Caenorhabditis briggsae TaxID=6238 RepID=A0AAE9FGM0_CAEBR|nr:hypothetical protein L5515_017888 [Caenorhabditis briggsae]